LKSLRTGLLLLISAAMAAPLSAHHSFAMFDPAREVTLQGTVKEFRWTNPHAFIQLMANGKGMEGEWSIEMTSPEHLLRIGWKPRQLKAGDKVQIRIHPMRDGTHGGQFLGGTGPDGAPLAGGVIK
jgi:Family of unknown function (DUF6152)